MKKFFDILFSRIIIVGVLVLLQLAFLAVVLFKLSEQFVYLYVFFVILSLIVIVYIVSRDDNPSYKLAWVIPVAVLPVFGVVLYLLFGGNKMRRRLKKQVKENYEEIIGLLVQDENILKEIEEKDKAIANEARYLIKYSPFPIYKNTKSQFLSPGEDFYQKLLEELKKAKKFIFMEYFIIHEGKMWDSILEILEEKVKEGVEVRLIYDDMGCITTLPRKYYKKMLEKGIKCLVFNEVMPIMSAVVNNRDHRKITIIDGNIAFTGGINLADEYINEKVRFGYWKDSAIWLKGEAVWNFTVMFLQVWNFGKREDKDFTLYKPNLGKEYEGDGYVLPYGDSPYDGETVGENVYLNIINKAKDYVYISTPYLIIDNELVTALSLAAKSGVDVRIVTPFIEDKWYAHMVTRAYYAQLIKAGVKIYEYTPGFIHSKTFVADDEVAVVGTINMDYRSLYLHFECGVFLYKTKSVFEIKEDYLKILEVSKNITIEDTKKVKWSNRFIRAILRVFAPLM